MSKDSKHEREAMEWIEGLVGDGVHDEETTESHEPKPFDVAEWFRRLDELNSEPFPSRPEQPPIPDGPDFD